MNTNEQYDGWVEWPSFPNGEWPSFAENEKKFDWSLSLKEIDKKKDFTVGSSIIPAKKENRILKPQKEIVVKESTEAMVARLLSHPQPNFHE